LETGCQNRAIKTVSFDIACTSYRAALFFSKTFGEQLDLPTDNWHLPENQPAPIIQQIEDESHVKLVFKEREITGLPSSSSSKANETAVFKKRKTASNRQLRGSSNKDGQKKDDADTN
jgi:hypothetical protein